MAIQKKIKATITMSDNITDIIVVISLLFISFMALVFFLFATPHFDDFCRSSSSLQSISYALDMYYNWTGRWFAMFLGSAALSQVRILSVGYPLIVICLWILYCVSIYSFINIVFYRTISCGLSALFAICFSALYWAGMPSPRDSIYWFTGSVEYELSLTLTILAIAALIRMSRKETPIAVRWIGGLFVSSIIFLITGLHEVAAAVLCLILSTGVLIAFRVRAAGRWIWILALGVSLFGLAVSVFAPGNLARAEHFPHSGDGVAAIGAIRWKIEHTIIPWVVDGKLLCASAFLVTSAWFSRAQPAWISLPGVPWKRTIPVVWILAVVAITAIPAWVTGTTGPSRLHNYVYALFLIGWLLTLFIWTRDIANDHQTRLRRSVHVASGSLLALSLVTAPNSIKGIDDLTGETGVSEWRSAVQARYAVMEKAQSLASIEIVLQPIPRSSRILDFGDISQDPNAPHNKCLAQYFGISAVTLGNLKGPETQ